MDANRVEQHSKLKDISKVKEKRGNLRGTSKSKSNSSKPR